jgi:hypothetical protein
MDVAEAAAPDNPSFLLFAGTDLSRYSAFFNGGLVWSPAGLDADGFTFKTLLDGGGYIYTSEGLHADIQGTMLSAAAMPGWRFTRGRLNVSVVGGVVVQDYRLSPYDPSSRLRGFYIGAEFAADAWYQPSDLTMVAVNAEVASIGPSGSLRLAMGLRLFGPVYVGPETQGIWSGDFQEMRFGMHITGWRNNAFEWSESGGWSMTSDQRSGPYLRFGISARY